MRVTRRYMIVGGTVIALAAGGVGAATLTTVQGGTEGAQGFQVLSGHHAILPERPADRQRGVRPDRR